MKRLFFARSFVFGKTFFYCRPVWRRKRKKNRLSHDSLSLLNLKFNTMKKHTANVNAVFVFTKQLCEKEMAY